MLLVFIVWNLKVGGAYLSAVTYCLYFQVVHLNSRSHTTHQTSLGHHLSHLYLPTTQWVTVPVYVTHWLKNLEQTLLNPCIPWNTPYKHLTLNTIQQNQVHSYYSVATVVNLMSRSLASVRKRVWCSE